MLLYLRPKCCFINILLRALDSKRRNVGWLVGQTVAYVYSFFLFFLIFFFMFCCFEASRYFLSAVLAQPQATDLAMYTALLTTMLYSVVLF